MNYIRIKALFGIALCSSLFLSLNAQDKPQPKVQRADTLRRELLVVSDQEVQIERATPPAAQYTYDKPKVTRLKPIPPRSTGDFTPPVVVPRYPMLSSLAAQVPSDGLPGYLHLSGGIDPNLRAYAGYSQMWQQRHQFDAQVGYHFLDHKASLAGMISPIRSHDAEGFIGYGYHGDKGVWRIQLGAGYDKHNYFAPNPLLPSSGGMFISPLETSEDYERLQLSYQSLPNQRWEGGVQLAYDHSGLHSSTWDEWEDNRVDEHRFLAQFGLRKPIQENSFRLGFDAEFMGQVVQSEGRALQTYSGKMDWQQAYLLEVVPHFLWNSYLGATRVQLYAGVGGGFFSSLQFPFYLFPRVQAELTFSPHVQLFARAEGGAKPKSRYEIGRSQRFLMPHQLVTPEVFIVESELGVKTNWGYGISAELSGGYDIASVATFFAPQLLRLDASPRSTVTFAALYDRAHSFFFRGRLAYSWGEKLQLSLGTTYRHYKLRELSVAEGAPAVVVEGEGLYRPTEKLSFALSTRLHYGIKYSVAPDASYHYRDVKLGAYYRLAKMWSLHAEVKNPIFGASEYPFAYRDYYPFAFTLGATMLF